MNDESPTPNLWPTFSQSTRTAPISIVRQQATSLGQHTRNMVVGLVVPSKKEDDPDTVVNLFFLVASTINYRLRLFSMRNELSALYPVRISSNFLGDKGEKGEPKAGQWEANDEKGLLAALREIFHHPKTVAAIEAMIAQSEAEPSPEEPPF